MTNPQVTHLSAAPQQAQPTHTIDGWTEITDANFEAEVLQSPEVVLVEFYGNQCSACRMFESTLEKFAKHYAGKFKLLRSNSAYGHKYQQQYGYAGEPTTAIFYGGEPQGSVLGSSDLTIFEMFLQKELSKLATKYNLPPFTRSW